MVEFVCLPGNKIRITITFSAEIYRNRIGGIYCFDGNTNSFKGAKQLAQHISLKDKVFASENYLCLKKMRIKIKIFSFIDAVKYNSFASKD